MHQRYRVAYFGLSQLLHAGDEEAHFACFKLLFVYRFRGKYSELFYLAFGLGGHEAHFVFQFQAAVFHADEHHHADIVVEPRIDNHSLQRRVFVAFGGGDFGHDFFQHVFHAQPGFGRAGYCAHRVDADDVFNFLRHAVGVGGGQVDFVQHGHDFHAQINRRVAVGHGWRFHTLRRVHHQQRAFAGGQAARHFVREIDMSRGVNQVQQVGFAVFGFVVQRGGLRLNRDAALFFDVHAVQNLRTHFAVFQAAAVLDEAVGERGFTVVNMGDDGEIADIVHILAKK